MKVIYSKYDKKLIPTLPRIVFSGRKVVVISEAEAEKAVDYLLKQDILGFDTETRPAFKKGITHKVALLQVSTYDTCFLFRLNRIGLCPAIVRLLESTSVKKVGLSWGDDLAGLHRRGDFEAKGFIDIQDHMNEIGIVDKSLAKLYANIFGERISKREQLSNWEADVLSEKQQNYAATDAWATIMLYNEYERLKLMGDYELIVVPEEVPETNKADDETNIS